MPYNRGSNFQPGGVSFESPEVTGTLEVNGELEVGEVSGCQGDGISYGIATKNSTEILNINSARENGAGNVSVRTTADVNVANIDNDHIISRLAWKDSSDQCEPVWDLYRFKFSSYQSSSFEAVGNEPNEEGAVGTVVGSDTLLTASNAKLLQVVNGDYERSYVDHSGSRVYGISDFGGYVKEEYWSELVVPLSGAYTDTEMAIPAGAVVYGVGVRVVGRVPFSASEFPTTGTFGVGVSASVGSFSEKWGDGLFADPGVTNLTSSMKDGFTYYSEDTPIRLRFEPAVSDQSASFGSGSVRVECRYRMVIPPQE